MLTDLRHKTMCFQYLWALELRSAIQVVTVVFLLLGIDGVHPMAPKIDKLVLLPQRQDTEDGHKPTLECFSDGLGPL